MCVVCKQDYGRTTSRSLTKLGGGMKYGPIKKTLTFDNDNSNSGSLCRIPWHDSTNDVCAVLINNTSVFKFQIETYYKQLRMKLVQKLKGESVQEEEKEEYFQQNPGRKEGEVQHLGFDNYKDEGQ